MLLLNKKAATLRGYALQKRIALPESFLLGTALKFCLEKSVQFCLKGLVIDRSWVMRIPVSGSPMQI